MEKFEEIQRLHQRMCEELKLSLKCEREASKTNKFLDKQCLDKEAKDHAQNAALIKRILSK